MAFLIKSSRPWTVLRTLIVLCGSLLSTEALAQSSIAGVVRDTSGAVLPGVTVAASSPALIERQRAGTTNENGQYRIADLRAGVYTVTFSLTGFGTVKQEGLDLSASFTATLNAEMRIGALEESVTVSAESSLVDTKSAVQQSVMSREVLDEVPTGRNVFAVGALIAGTTQGKPDVGGSEGAQGVSMQVHGSQTQDVNFSVDGMIINNPAGTGGATGVYYNDALIEEVIYETSAIPAEVSQGGVRINMLPKEGGNVFHGAIFATGAAGGMQSDNLSQELKDRGLKAANHLDNIYDFNFSLGGPIQPNRLWFYSSYRRWGVNGFVANTFNADGSQALDDGNLLTSSLLRMTVQLTQGNKVSAYYDKNGKDRAHRRDGTSEYQFIEPEASRNQIQRKGYTAQAKWTSAMSNQLLFEAGVSFFHLHSHHDYQPEIKSTDVAKIDFVRSTLSNASIFNYHFYAPRQTTYLTQSYVTGAHSFKAGVQYGTARYRQTYVINQDMHLRFKDGVADSVDIWNTPVDSTDRLNADVGIFVQDAWTIKRATINAGLRWEYFNSSVPAQVIGAGQFVEARSFPAKEDQPKWTSVVPRLALAYDVFGDGKTAAKVSVSKYGQNQGMGIASSVNPAVLQSDRRSWADVNGDGEAQLNELGPSTGFRGGRNQRIDSEMTRPYNWEYVVSLQREILPRMSVHAAYYRREIRNQFGVKNLLAVPSSYRPVTIKNPLTGAPLTVYDQDPATRSAVDLFVSNYDELDATYNGFELKIDKRFTKGTLFGGFTAGRKEGSILGSTSDLNNPNVLINHVGAVGLDSTYQFKVAGSYPLPYGLALSGVLQTSTGLPLRRTYTVTRSDVPNLTQVTQAIDAQPRGEARLERLNLLDFRITKGFALGKARLDAVMDIYNVLNTNVTTGEVEAIGSRLGTPVDIVNGRFTRLGIKLNF